MTNRLKVSWKKLITIEGAIHEFNFQHLKCLIIHNCELSCLLETLQMWCQKVHLDIECSNLSIDCDRSKSNTFVAAKIKSGMDRVWEILNTGTWKDVPEFIKHIYTLLCYYKVVAILNSISLSNWTLKLVEDCIQILDKGILLGYNNSLVSHAMQCLMEMYNTLSDENSNDNKKSGKSPTSSDVVMSSWKITGIRGTPVQEVHRPCLLHFQRDYLCVKRPAKLLDCVKHWPALQAWHLGYFRRLAGPRLVPIELGKKYTDEDWSQKLMSLNEFLDNHMNEDSHAYLAQHDLLSQIPQLKRDIMVPDYCYLHTGTDNDKDEDTDTNDDEDSRDVDLNMWLGPPGTVTPFHWDAKHNLLVQVLGTKRVLLAAPGAPMYPHEGLLNNTSRVDPESEPELLAREFPDFLRHPVQECTLHPGDMLYIPPRHWHHVRSLSTSISVSFWF